MIYKKIGVKWLLILFIPIIIFVKVFPNIGFQYVGTSGDFYGVINPEKTFLSNLYAFRSNLNNGYADNTANLFSNNSSYLVYEFTLSKLGFSQLARTHILIFLLSIFGFINMYHYLSKKYITKKTTKNSLFYISILYGFSPYFITYFSPGHFLFLLLFGFFPLIQLYFEGILDATKDSFSLSLKYFSQLSLVLLFVCITFANLGVFAIFIMLMIGQAVIQFLLRRLNLKQLILSIALFIISCFVSNIWWLAPQLASMTSFSAMVLQSKQTIGSSIHYATQNSNVLNIISGFPEGTNSSFLLSIFQINLLLILVVVLITSLKNKQKISTSLLVIILLTVFFTKGPNAPFGNIFNYLYAKIDLLQVIRRPASKLYWIVIFYMLSLAYSVIAKNRIKLFTLTQNSLLSIAAILAIVITSQNVKLRPFNIPNEYYQANQYLLDSGVNKVFLLPDLGGLSPNYNKELNFHQGIDFISQIWEFKKYIPSSTAWNLADREADLVNKLADTIYQGNDICEISKKLNISHVVIRKDLLPTNYSQILLEKADKSLSKSKNISEVKEFGNSFKTFKIVGTCQSKLLSANFGTNFKYIKINPTLIKLNISSQGDQMEIVYREKYDNSWILHTGSLESLISSPFPHSIALGYANGWSVDLKKICSDTKNLCTYTKNGYSLDLYIEYWPQQMYYFGLFISGTTLSLCVLFLIKYSRKKNQKQQ